jgi:hypothetical protein
MRAAIQATIVGGITLIAALNGRAQDQQGFTSFGIESCGRFLQAVDGERKARPRNPVPDADYTSLYALFEGYALGFLTGANWAMVHSNNYEEANVGNSMNDHFAGAMAWLETYCRQHPLDNYYEALEHLRVGLAAKERQ